MEPESILQSYLVRIGQLISQQPIETVPDLRDTAVKTVQRQIRRWTDHPIMTEWRAVLLLGLVV
jgi:hypothetical protein